MDAGEPDPFGRKSEVLALSRRQRVWDGFGRGATLVAGLIGLLSPNQAVRVIGGVLLILAFLAFIPATIAKRRMSDRRSEAERAFG